MKEQIKLLRVKIDSLKQLTENLKPITLCGNPTCKDCVSINSNEIDNSVKSLMFAKAWLGKLLGELGEKNPYSSGKKTLADIEPTADVAKEVEDFPVDSKGWEDNINNVSHIEKVDWLITEIEITIGSLVQIGGHVVPTRESAIARTNAYTHLVEAKVWLGYEFQRIREDSV